jgi:acyl-CoA synthetase (AMP-forming)/AMP-acid ligase II
MSLGVRLKEIPAIDPAVPAIEFEGLWHSWGSLARSHNEIDAALRDAGLHADARAGVRLRNHVAIVPAVLAVVGEGRCLVTLNPVLVPEEVAADVLNTQVAAIIGLESDLAPLGDALREARCLVIVVQPNAADPLSIWAARDWSAVHRILAEGVAVEMLTSGATGAPKRIAMQRSGFEGSVFAAAHFEKGRSGEDKPVLRSGVQLLMVPFAHIVGLLALMDAMVAGRSAAILSKFNVPGFRDVLKRHAIKVVSAPPAARKMILDAGVGREALNSLMAFRTGTAPLDPDLGDSFYERYGIPVLQNYGAAEFGGVARWTLGDFETYSVSKRGAVGRLNPGVEGRVVDEETATPVEPGEPGTLELRAPQIADGGTWLRTTDLARLDADGFLFILGGTDNVIIRGGFKIQPDDVVRADEGHLGAREAVVAAHADARLGQVSVLAILPRVDSEAPSSSAPEAYLRGRFSPYQMPVASHQLRDFPRTPSLKVDRTALKKLIEARS